jgi:hypothetical protein
MIAMKAFFGAFIDGRLDSFTTHSALMGIVAVAEVCLAVGIWLESPKHKTCREWIGICFVIGSCFISILATVGLLVFDEGITRQMLAYRHLSSEQTTRLIAVTNRFPSLNFITFTVAENEPWGLGIEVGKLLRNNGWNWLPCDGSFSKLQSPYPGIPVFCWTILAGIQIEGAQVREEAGHALVDAFRDPDVIGMENVRWEKSDAFSTIAIMVGSKREVDSRAIGVAILAISAGLY